MCPGDLRKAYSLVLRVVVSRQTRHATATVQAHVIIYTGYCNHWTLATVQFPRAVTVSPSTSCAPACSEFAKTMTITDRESWPVMGCSRSLSSWMDLRLSLVKFDASFECLEETSKLEQVFLSSRAGRAENTFMRASKRFPVHLIV